LHLLVEVVVVRKTTVSREDLAAVPVFASVPSLLVVRATLAVMMAATT
jgi:hypothetical protein